MDLSAKCDPLPSKTIICTSLKALPLHVSKINDTHFHLVMYISMQVYTASRCIYTAYRAWYAHVCVHHVHTPAAGALVSKTHRDSLVLTQFYTRESRSFRLLLGYLQYLAADTYTVIDCVSKGRKLFVKQTLHCNTYQ